LTLTKLSDIAELSESDLPLVVLANLNISIKVSDSSTLLFFELSVLLFSSLAYVSFLSGRSFFPFIFICQLANKSSVLASLVFAFFLLNPIFNPISDQTLVSLLVFSPISKYSGL